MDKASVLEYVSICERRVLSSYIQQHRMNNVYMYLSQFVLRTDVVEDEAGLLRGMIRKMTS